MVMGVKPVSLSLDNYFVDRELTPLDERGQYDFESINALDLPLFNQQLKALMEGKEVETPRFNFTSGIKEYVGDKLKVDQHSVLILEGIHALNPDLLIGIDPSFIFKVYVSALTSISLDNHNWIPTTDNRLLRRIIRDSRYRGYSAIDTISRWDSVRSGEEKWIFPFQENADAMFNSALIFEFSVLRMYAEPILRQVPQRSSAYTEAHRLLRFLEYFVPISEPEIPRTSLLREFLGGSSFRY
jgi:uridine kinase